MGRSDEAMFSCCLKSSLVESPNMEVSRIFGWFRKLVDRRVSGAAMVSSESDLRKVYGRCDKDKI